MMSEYRMEVVETGLGAFAWQLVRDGGEVLAQSRSYSSRLIAVGAMDQLIDDLGLGDLEHEQCEP